MSAELLPQLIAAPTAFLAGWLVGKDGWAGKGANAIIRFFLFSSFIAGDLLGLRPDLPFLELSANWGFIVGFFTWAAYRRAAI